MRSRFVALGGAVFGTMLLCSNSARAGENASDSAACVAIREQAEATVKAGKLVAAREQLDRCAQAVCAEEVRAACSRRRDAIESTIPTVAFGVRDSAGRDIDAVVTIDESQSPVALGRLTMLEPGLHDVQWSSPASSGRQKLTVFEGERGRIVILGIVGETKDASSAPAARASSPASHGDGKPSWPWIVAGAGAFLVTTATVFQLVALREDSDRKTLDLSLGRTDLSATERDLYQRSRQSHQDAAKTDQAIAITVGTVGLAAIVGGVTWALLRNRHTEVVGVKLTPTLTATGPAFAF